MRAWGLDNDAECDGSAILHHLGLHREHVPFLSIV
jgi:hypothetical protein